MASNTFCRCTSMPPLKSERRKYKPASSDFLFCNTKEQIGTVASSKAEYSICIRVVMLLLRMINSRSFS